MINNDCIKIMMSNAVVNTPNAANKRIRSSPLDRDHSKKHKENQTSEKDDEDDDEAEISVDASEAIEKLTPIMFIGIDKEYANDPSKIKQDLDENYPNIKIKSTRVTMKGNLIIDFENLEELRKFACLGCKIKCHKSILLNNREELHEIVIKGVNYQIASRYLEQLKKQGIIAISHFNKRKIDYKIIKASCVDANSAGNLCKAGVKIEYCNYRAELYNKPIRPVQCFKCQKFGHIANKCLETESTCVKCGDKHKLSECKAQDNVLKCANCQGNHTSSFAGCTVYQKYLKEKIEKIQKKTSNVNAMRLYSEVAQNNKVNEFTLSDLKATVEKMTLEMSNMRELYKNMMDNILVRQTVLDESIKKVNQDCQEILFRIPLIILDIFHAVFPNIKNSQVHRSVIFDSLKRHKVTLPDQDEFQEYIDNLFKK